MAYDSGSYKSYTCNNYFVKKDFPECCQDNNVIQLSRDHKPEIPQEKERVIKSGGRVDKYTGL